MSTKAPNPVDKYVGSRVRMRRIMLGMSQEKLGEALGLTFQQVQKYEKGTNRVGASRIQQISEILQVPVSFLFEGGPTGSANADGFAEGDLAVLHLRFPRDVGRVGAHPRVHAHRRRQASAQHRRSGRADRRARGGREALTTCLLVARISRLTRPSGRAHEMCAQLPDGTPMTAQNPFDSSDHPRRHPPLGRDRDADRRSRAGQQARDRWSPISIAACRRRSSASRARTACGDHLVARSAWGQDAPGILVLSHLDTVHPMGFIDRLPFKVEGDSAFGPGIYDMKGGAYIALSRVPPALCGWRTSPLGITHLYASDEEIGSPTSRALIETEGAEGQICAGDRARARRRQDRDRAQGRRTLRGLHQGRAGACRHAARGRPQRRSANSPTSSRRWKR